MLFAQGQETPVLLHGSNYWTDNSKTAIHELKRKCRKTPVLHGSDYWTSNSKTAVHEQKRKYSENHNSQKNLKIKQYTYLQCSCILIKHSALLPAIRSPCFRKYALYTFSLRFPISIFSVAKQNIINWGKLYSTCIVVRLEAPNQQKYQSRHS